jgi:hypothetical protein
MKKIFMNFCIIKVYLAWKNTNLLYFNVYIEISRKVFNIKMIYLPTSYNIYINIYI